MYLKFYKCRKVSQFWELTHGHWVYILFGLTANGFVSFVWNPMLWASGYLENQDKTYFKTLPSALSFQDHKKYEPPHDKTNKMACATSEDSDQPGHPPSLIRVFAVHMKKAWVLSYPWAHREDSDQTGQMPRLIWVFAGRTVILLVVWWGGSYLVL